METWKTVDGFEGLYEISTLGNVRNRNGLVLKRMYDKDGYPYVNLCNRRIRKRKYLHRLVAIAFIPNPNCYPQVNHKDEDKRNSNAENLEWCTPLYNTRYGTGIQRSHTNRDNEAMALNLAKPIAQYDLFGKLIAVYPSSRAAEIETGIKSSSIRNCTCGRNKQAGGYCWARMEK